jgi:hypothetical protein
MQRKRVAAGSQQKETLADAAVFRYFTSHPLIRMELNPHRRYCPRRLPLHVMDLIY